MKFYTKIVAIFFWIGSIIPSGTWIEISEMSDSYEYVATSSINCMDNIIIFIANDI